MVNANELRKRAPSADVLGGAIGTEAWVARAVELHPAIEAAADRIERDRELPGELVTALQDRQLFRMLVPQTIGGGEVSPVTFIEVVEALATADASTAWVVAQGCGCSMGAAYLAPKVAVEVFGADDAVAAWGPPSPGGKATVVDGGYRLEGQWHFASGNRHAAWMGANCQVTERDGMPRLGPDGQPAVYTFLFPRAAADVADDWQVLGLRGTGSDSYRLDGHIVPASHVFVRESDAYRRERGALYRFTALNIYGLGVAATAMGIARVMLRQMIGVAQFKVERTTGKPMRESTSVQARVAEAEARLASARVFLLSTVDELYQQAQTGQAFTKEGRTRLRLATAWAAQQAREVAEIAFLSVGTNAIFQQGPFERRFRDIHTLTQQVQAHLSNFDLVGQSLLGLPLNSRLI